MDSSPSSSPGPTGGSDTGVGATGPAPVTHVASGASVMDIMGDPNRGEWWTWWRVHRELYVDLARLVPETPGDDQRPESPLWVGKRLVPNLEAVLAEGDLSPDLERACLIALGRLRAGELSLRSRLASKRAPVAEAAALSLGLHGGTGAVRDLIDLLTDTDAGRQLVGRSEVPVRVRAFATYGLVIASEEARPALRTAVLHAMFTALDSDERHYPDLQAALAIGIGSLPAERLEGSSPALALEAQVAFLLEAMDEDAPLRTFRVHAPTALAKLWPHLPEISQGPVREALLDLVDPRSRTRGPVRRSAVIALGEILTSDQADAAGREALARCATDGARRFAWLALARAASRMGQGEDAWHGVEDARELLRKQTQRGRSGSNAWAALALGVMEHHLAARGVEPDRKSGEALTNSLRRSRNGMDAAAMGLGLGLSNGEGAEHVRKRLEDTANPLSLAHLSLGVGFLNASGDLSKLMDEHDHTPEVFEGAALARGIDGDSTLLAELIERLDDCDCSRGTRGPISVLGWARDARAVEALVAILKDPEKPRGTRVNAAEALGRIGDLRDPGALVRLRAHTNYLDAPPSFYGGEGYGVIDCR